MTQSFGFILTQLVLVLRASPASAMRKKSLTSSGIVPVVGHIRLRVGTRIDKMMLLRDLVTAALLVIITILSQASYWDSS